VSGEVDRVDDATMASHQIALQAEAKEVLVGMGELAALRALGPLLETGSYVSGLMCWRDLDVGVLVGSDFTPTDVLNLAINITEAVDVASFTYRDERGARSPIGERRDERFHLPLQVV
jgi:hypothetical protein